MTKADLIDNIAETGVSKKQATEAVECIIETIKNALRSGDKVNIAGLGCFEVKKRAPRKGRNPKTGEEIQIPGKMSPVFRAGKQLKEAVK
ncbi:MAG: HU family DNA-binding protein [Candidatus Firestonebacteria bacterium]|nr:HU family DNA-binding protein [Candidatus Firestonebacteria bacterium]